MINNHMDLDKEIEQEDTKPVPVPNESSGIYIRNFLRNKDPESGEVFLETAN